jgi:hypothetical protein
MKRKRGQRVSWDNVGFCRRAESVRADLRFLREQVEMSNLDRGIDADDDDVRREALRLLRQRWLRNGIKP